MTMITPSYLGETIEYSSLHACRSTLEDPNSHRAGALRRAQVLVLSKIRLHGKNMHTLIALKISPASRKD